jgi:hypothetical protein
VSKKQPYRVQKNAAFVIDLGDQDPMMMICNLESDDNGAYTCMGTRTSTWKTEEESIDNFEVQEFRMLSNRKDTLTTSDQYHLVRKYRHFNLCEDFNKIISYAIDRRGIIMNNVAFVQYYFDSGVERPFVVKRHGNAVRTSAPYKSTNASTKAIVRELINVDKPKTIHSNLTKGVEKASEMATSCSRRTIYDINRSKKKRNVTLATNAMTFYDIIAMIREQDAQKNTENRFIRYISAYPDPELLVLGYDSQFRDLDRFCTSPVNFSILSIDPTFNLGAFYVMPMSYENLFLVSNRMKKHPTFLGPVLISHNLDESCYSHLTFVTTQKSPLLEDNLIAFGTDGEKALYNQFGKKFKSAVHVRCIGHFRENCKTHLKGVSLENQNKILNDIFGKNIEDTHYGGYFHSLACHCS